MKIKSLGSVSLIAVFIIFSGNLPAQIKEKKPGEKRYIMEEIVVTATRTETPYKEVASSLTVITKEEIENKQQTLLLDFLRTVPALDVAQSGGPGKTTSVFIRGAKSEHTLVLIDGIEANDPISPSRSFDFATLTTDNVERIEILRGPQSTLYGSDAIAGVINIITKKGVGKPRFSLSTEAGSFSTFNNSAGVSGGGEWINYSLNLSRFITDGISAAKKSDGNIEKDGYASTSLSARMGITPYKNSGIDVILRYLDTSANIDNFGGTGGDDPNNVQDSEQLYVRAEARFLSVKNLWEQKFGFSLTDLNRSTKNDFDAAHPNDMLRDSYDGTMFKFDWQNNIYLNVNNTLTFGMETEEEKASSEFYSEGIYGPFTSIFEEHSARTNGYYVQDQMKIRGSIFVTAGLRIDANSKFGTETTYRIAPAFLLNRTGTKIKATYGTGFKSPSLFQLYSQYGNEELSPEKSRAWDIGLEQYLLGEKAGFGITYFHSDFGNLIDYDFGTSTYKNLAEVESGGVELSAFAQNVFGFDLQANYTYTSTKEKTTGEALLRRPKNKLGLNLNYQISAIGRSASGGIERCNVNLEVIAVGKRDDIFISPDFTTTRVNLDKYVLFNLAAAYDITGNFQIFSRIDNLFDTKYEEILGYGTYGLSAYAGLKIRY